jgi:hypothetical protein
VETSKYSRPSGGGACASLRLTPDVAQRPPVAVDGDHHVVIRGYYHHHPVQPVKARFDIAIAFHFPPADEIEPDACAVLEDTIPANEIQIVHTQVALRSAMPRVPSKLHLSLNVHCSTPFGVTPDSSKPEQPDGREYTPPSVPGQLVYGMWKTVAFPLSAVLEVPEPAVYLGTISGHRERERETK